MSLDEWNAIYGKLKDKLLAAAYHNDTKSFEEIAVKLNKLPTFCSCEGCIKNAEDSRGK